MPKPNPLNPICPLCGNHTSRNGKTSAGANQYRCRRDNFTCTDSDRPAYKLGEKSGKAKSQKQRTAEWKERDPIGYEAARLRKQENRKKKK